MLCGNFARLVWKMNFMNVSGLIAGSMTDPPALAFASNIASSDAPTVAHATVYPLTTLLRILSAQILAITLVSPSGLSRLTVPDELILCREPK